MLSLAVHVHLAVLATAHRLAHGLVRRRSEGGQTSAEYALVLLGAAAVALLVAAWARRGNRVGALLDAVFDDLIDMVG
jgi:hypothetical protein